MRFSIVIPVHNGENYLASAIASVMNQQRKADEIVVLDDASTDKTSKIAQSSQWYGSVKYVYNEKATGFVDAWNRAAIKASGDFVTILHHDDLLHPEYLLHVEKALLRYSNSRHIYTACNYIDEKDKIIVMPPEPYSLDPVLYSGRDYAHNYLNGVVNKRHIHRCPGVTTSKDLLLYDCSFRKDAGHIADDDFFLRVGAYTDVVGISQPLASARMHAQSATSNLELLSFTLAEDYLFQVRYYKEQKQFFLSSFDIAKLNRQAVKFINLLLFESILYKKKNFTERALKLRKELDEMLPSFMDKNLPLWAQKMWEIVLTGDKYRIATLYVKFLKRIVKTRDFIKVVVRGKIKLF